MTNGIVSKALSVLTSVRGAALASLAMLAIASLINVSSTAGVAKSPAATTTSASETTGEISAAQAGAIKLAAAGEKGTFTPKQVDAIEAIIKDYLIKNPRIMLEVTRALEQLQREELAKQQAAVIASNKAKIFDQTVDYALGNGRGDVTVVEFFDYNCGWCKRALNDIVKLSKADPKLRIIMKEFPIFGEASTLAAKAALASQRQNKYWAYHTALMREQRVTTSNVFEIAEQVGLDVEQLKKDMQDPAFDAAIRQNIEVARALNMEGTPAFIIDSKVSVGYLPADAIRGMVADIRKSGCQMC